MTKLPNSHSVCGRLAITSLLLVVSVTPVALAEPTPEPPDEAVPAAPTNADPTISAMTALLTRVPTARPTSEATQETISTPESVIVSVGIFTICPNLTGVRVTFAKPGSVPPMVVP